MLTWNVKNFISDWTSGSSRRWSIPGRLLSTMEYVSLPVFPRSAFPIQSFCEKFLFSFQDTVSVHRPSFYADRFLKFLSTTVFKKAHCKHWRTAASSPVGVFSHKLCCCWTPALRGTSSKRKKNSLYTTKYASQEFLSSQKEKEENMKALSMNNLDESCKLSSSSLLDTCQDGWGGSSSHWVFCFSSWQFLQTTRPSSCQSRFFKKWRRAVWKQVCCLPHEGRSVFKCKSIRVIHDVLITKLSSSAMTFLQEGDNLPSYFD